jgi:hypothetical protein
MMLSCYAGTGVIERPSLRQIDTQPGSNFLDAGQFGL